MKVDGGQASALSTYIVRVGFGSGGLGQPALPTPTASGQATGSAGDSRRYTESVTLAFKFDEALALWMVLHVIINLLANPVQNIAVAFLQRGPGDDAT